ncbi:hypothetical protein [Halomontanus rarus]|uniref:hypothetical protein n=1 Tax=Halomontanus rarus TaxID=3034020 RepID=UPI00307B8A65
MNDRPSGGTGRSFISRLADEVTEWMIEDPSREDICDEVWAFALATFVDGTAITPRGFDETGRYTQTATEQTGGADS